MDDGTIVSNNGIRQIYVAIPLSPFRIDPSIQTPLIQQNILKTQMKNGNLTYV